MRGWDFGLIFGVLLYDSLDIKGKEFIFGFVWIVMSNKF